MREKVKQLIKLILLVFFISSCSRDDYKVSNSKYQYGKLVIENVSIKDLNNNPLVKQSIMKIQTQFDFYNKIEKEQRSFSENEITVLTDNIVKVKTDHTETYAFQIEPKTDNNSAFENLVIDVIEEDVYEYYIYRYQDGDDTEQSYKVTRDLVSPEELKSWDFDWNQNEFMQYDHASNCLFEVHPTYVEVISCGSSSGSSGSGNSSGSGSSSGGSSGVGGSSSGGNASGDGTGHGPSGGVGLGGGGSSSGSSETPSGGSISTVGIVKDQKILKRNRIDNYKKNQLSSEELNGFNALSKIQKNCLTSFVEELIDYKYKLYKNTKLYPDEAVNLSVLITKIINSSSTNVEKKKLLAKIIDETFPKVNGVTHEEYKKEILRFARHLTGFGSIEDKLYADYLFSIADHAETLDLSELHEIYLEAREKVHELRVNYFMEITTVIVTDLVFPLIEYALTEASLGAATYLLRRIPVSYVARYERLYAMVKKVGVMGEKGKTSNIRIVRTNNPVKKCKMKFKTLTKDALEKTINPKNGAITANMGYGNYITYRPITASTSNFEATISFNFPKIWTKMRDVKFTTK